MSVDLARVAQRLEFIYSAAVTVQWALRGQNADQDADFARCLMQQISEPLSAQIEALQVILACLAPAHGTYRTAASPRSGEFDSFPAGSL